MVLKAQKTNGKRYFKNSFDRYQSTFEKSAEKKLQEWLQKYFK